jgi:alpha-L-arabinofuranosidase
MTVLHAADKEAFNTLDRPENVAPVEKTLDIKTNKFDLLLEASSVTVIRVLAKKL